MPHTELARCFYDKPFTDPAVTHLRKQRRNGITNL
jgi:hypothetical protein